MGFINTITSTVDWGVVSSYNAVNKVATSPPAVKKVGQIISKVIEMINYQKATQHLPELVRNITGTNEMIDLYGTFKNVIFWLNPFEVQKIDKKAFIDSLGKSIDLTNKTDGTKKKAKKIKAEESKLNQLFAKIMKEAYSTTNPRTISQVLENSLIAEGYSQTAAKEICERVVIKLQPRSTLSILKIACSSISDFGSNLLVLQKWNLINLEQIAKQIGTQVPTFAFVSKLSLTFSKSIISCCGSSFSILDSCHTLIKTAKILSDTNQTEEAIKQAEKETNHAQWNIVCSCADLLQGLPLFMTLNPPVIITLSLVSSGTGLLAIFLKK